VGGIVPRGYAAGKTDRTDPDFFGTSLGVNVTADMYLDAVVRRSRALADDNPIIDGLLSTIVNNTVGSSGIYPEAATGDAEVDAQINEIVHGAMEGVDASREITLAESQARFVREVACGGEALTHVPIVDAFRGHARGPAIELVDRDLIPLTMTGELLDGGNGAMGMISGAGLFAGGKPFVRQGVEFDALGRRVAYYVYKVHPNDGFLGTQIAGPVIDRDVVRRLPATSATLGFRPRRVGQVRGVPWIASTIRTVRDEDAFREAYLMLARTAACLSAFIKGYTPPVSRKSGIVGESAPDSPFQDLAGVPFDRLEPGMIGILPPGAELQIASANLPPPTFAETIKLLHRSIAAGAGIAYSVLAHDYASATFSAIRAESLESRSGYRTIQSRNIWAQHSLPWYCAVIDWAWLSGKIKISAEFARRLELNPRLIYKHSVVAPGWEWVNPQQEAQAAEAELRMGSATLAQICAQKGQSWRTVMAQRCKEEVEWNRQREAAGLEPAPLPYERVDGSASQTPNANDGVDPQTGEPQGETSSGAGGEDQSSNAMDEAVVRKAARDLGLGDGFVERFANVPVTALATLARRNGHARGTANARKGRR